VALDETRRVLPLRYAVMTRLRGEPLRVRFGMPDAERLFREMGALLRRMSGIAMPRHGYLLASEVARPFDTNLERMTAAFEAKYRDFRGWGGDEGLLCQIQRYVGARFDALGECGAPMLCHNDFHPGNVLVALGADGAWQITGVIDFDNAIAGDPLWDLAKALDFTTHECAAGRTPLEAGYREAGSGALDRPGAEEAVTLYRIFHKFELVNSFKSLRIQTQGAAALIADLDELTATG
jgi:aminoglycoside phosphotransferase (APT) family kinase protein